MGVGELCARNGPVGGLPDGAFYFAASVLRLFVCGCAVSICVVPSQPYLDRSPGCHGFAGSRLRKAQHSQPEDHLQKAKVIHSSKELLRCLHRTQTQSQTHYHPFEAPSNGSVKYTSLGCCKMHVSTCQSRTLPPAATPSPRSCLRVGQVFPNSPRLHNILPFVIILQSTTPWTPPNLSPRSARNARKQPSTTMSSRAFCWVERVYMSARKRPQTWRCLNHKL